MLYMFLMNWVFLLCWNIILFVGQWDKQPVWCKFWAKYSMSHHPRAKQVTRMTRNTPGSLPRERCEEVLHRPKKKVLIQLVFHDIPLIGKFPLPCYKVPPFCLLVANDPPKKILEMESFLKMCELGECETSKSFFLKESKEEKMPEKTTKQQFTKTTVCKWWNVH